MSRPRIGITLSNLTDEGQRYIAHAYLHAVHGAGGQPVALAYDMPTANIEPLIASLDGVLFTGGGDVAPCLYACAREAVCGEADALRDRMELRFFHRAFARRLPILGICRGAQLINIALGGTLIQDIPSHLRAQHRLSEGERHEVRILPGTRLRAIIGADRLCVNSLHHQSVAAPGAGLITSAYSLGRGEVAEAIERPAGRFLLGVQWHPERTYDGSEASRRVFAAFIAAAKGEKR